MSRQLECLAAPFRRHSVFVQSAMLCVLLVVGSVVEAAVIGTVTQVVHPPAVDFTQDTDYNSPPLSDNWVSYLLGAQTDDGTKIAGIDVTITGPLNQRWNFDADEDAFVPTPFSSNLSNGDSHFITEGSNAFFVIPWENNNLLAAPATAADTAGRDYGVGTRLRGAWVYPIAEQQTSINFAYIVVPKGREHEIGVHVELSTNPEQNPPLVVLDNLCTSEGGFTCFSGRGIGVVGNGAFIADGDISPSIVDNTDFGTVSLGSVQQRTFTITNMGVFPATLGTPTVTGPFSLLGSFPTTLATTGDVTFTLGLDTSAIGDVVGSISFPTNVPGRNPFNFALSARVIPEPSCAALFGLAVVGLAGFGRSRKYF